MTLLLVIGESMADGWLAIEALLNSTEDQYLASELAVVGLAASRSGVTLKTIQNMIYSASKEGVLVRQGRKKKYKYRLSDEAYTVAVVLAYRPAVSLLKGM